MSGFSATGATVLSGLDALPLSVNVWRCFLQLIGGLGIIVLAVAILPLLGVGGAQLFKAEIGRPDEGRQAHAAHRRDGARAVDRLLRLLRRLLLRLPLGRHELGGRLHAHVHDDGPGRLLVARRQLRLLELAADRGRGDRLHDAGRRQLRDVLRRLAPALAEGAVEQHRGASLLPDDPRRGAADLGLHVVPRHLPDLWRVAAAHGVPRRVDRDDHRLRVAGLRAVAAVRAAADAAAGLLRHLCRQHRWRHQDGAHAAAAQAVAARAGAHRAPQRRQPGGDGRAARWSRA